MTPEEIEAGTAEFLDARDAEPTLTPKAFVARWAESAADREELLASLEAVIELEQLLPGETPAPHEIGPYRVVRELGRGGMGIVYEVERDGEHAALKLHPLSPLLAGRAADRLRREIEALAGLTHPNIVRIRDSGVDAGAPYVVMELVHGRRLDEAGASLTRDRALQVVEALARAVAAAHAQGVIHRDLKPQNVILRDDGEPVLVDFGLSLADDLPSLTVTGEILGTPRYMAPEQVGDGPVDARTDVYGLGLILYELVTRRPARAARSREGLLREASDGSLTRPRTIDASIPKPVERVLLQALAVAPSDRYPSAGALAEDLARLRRGEPVSARPRRPAGAARRARRLLLPVSLFIVVIAASGLWLMRDRGALPPERQLEATRRLRHAFARYLDGDSLAARREARAALSIHRQDPSAQALAAHLDHGRLSARAAPGASVLLRALEAHDAADGAGVLRAIESGESAPIDLGIQSALQGLAILREGDPRRAEAPLARAVELFPESTHLLERLARVYQRQGMLPRASELLARATQLDSTSSELWFARSSVDFQRRDLDGGLRAIARAKQYGDSSAAELLLLEASLRANAGQGPRARALLRRILDAEPDRAEAWYQLGYSYDMDHLLVPAVHAYERTCALAPRHAAAWSCLANLFSGASRGQCQGCDSAFAAHPDLLDPVRAEASLLTCLRIDRGRQEWLTRSALDISLRLTQRGRILSLLDSLTSVDRESASGLRLAELMRRLRLTSGRG